VPEFPVALAYCLQHGIETPTIDERMRALQPAASQSRLLSRVLSRYRRRHHAPPGFGCVQIRNNSAGIEAGA
jgi:hypothetical protein